MSMRVDLLGGFGEKGRTSIAVRHGGRRILFDLGIKVGASGPDYYPALQGPLHDIDAVFISHAHEDHVGALAWLLSKGWRGRILMTKETRAEAPATLAGFSDSTNLPSWVQTILTTFGHGQPLYMIFYGGMIAFFTFFYTAIVFNPKETVDQLKKHSGFIPGYRPGERTADYIDYVLTRITVVGAIYLVAVCLLPEYLISATGIPFYLGGTSLLIVVSVTLDTVAQLQGHLVAHQYEGLIKKSKLRGGKRNR